jgi:peroxiredoxin
MSVPFLISYGALWVLVVLQGLVLLGLARTVYRLQAGGVALAELPSIDAGPTVGRPAPRFTAEDVFGKPFDSADFAGQTTAVLFVSPDCSTCTVTLEEMDALVSKVHGNVIVVCRSGRKECKRLVTRYGLTQPVVMDEQLEISKLFEIASVPTAILIDASNTIRQYGNPGRDDELEEMLLDQRVSEDGRAPQP